MEQREKTIRRKRQARCRKKALSRITALVVVCVLSAGAVHGIYSALWVKVSDKPSFDSEHKGSQAGQQNNTPPVENGTKIGTPPAESSTPPVGATPPEGAPPPQSHIDVSDWNLLLVNPWNSIPEEFEVERTILKNGHSIDKRAYPDLQAMMDDARAAGLSPIICSSFRTKDKQQSLFDKQVQKYLARGYSRKEAEEEAANWVAIPGTSEHQTALAVDIVALSYQMLDEKQETTAEQKWLMENCYRYGFVLRYPKDKTEVTGIGYEPWHYRYVGKEAAKKIWEQKICLEEYLQQ